MHATVQPGGRSPKPTTGPASASQLKFGSDNVQGSVTSYPSQVKGKKRERGDQGSEPVKRERSSKIDNGSVLFEGESILKSEIARITENGGLVDSEGVEKLVELMQPERVKRKMDLISRSMLAGVIAATNKFDCLSRFVQLRGLPVLDQWLQDVHKGKTGGGGSPKDGDKPVEEFLLVLLCALDKLPVNLHALQMCNIGKSVNHLRSHKNLEIQKKARYLIDTWKKRVEAEMNIIDAEPGLTQAVSWSSKSRLPEVSHGGNRRAVGSSEVAMRSSITQISASKTASFKPVQGETTMKSASSSPRPIKAAVSPSSGKDSQPRISVGSVPDIPLTKGMEEKSSSSSQSHYSQSFSGKEDARSSSAGSMSVNKISSGASRHRKSVNGFPGSAVSGSKKETGSSRSSSLQRNSAPEKILKSGLTCEKALDVPIVEGNSYKLIVKIPNRGRSPAQSVSVGSLDEPSIMNSRASSPVRSEKRDRFNRNLKGKSDANQANVMSDVNNESWQSNDFKDVLTGSDEGDGSPAANPDEERNRTVEDTRKLADISIAASSSSGNEQKSGEVHDSSFSSINALIESCVKYSEANASLSLGDDVGMNLLASVAAGEMSKSDLISPTDSPQTNNPMVEDTCLGDDAKSNLSPGDNIACDGSQLNNDSDGDNENRLHLSKHTSVDFSGDKKTVSSSEETPAGEDNENFNYSRVDLQPNADPCLGTSVMSDEMKGDASVPFFPACTEEKMMEVSNELNVDKAVVTAMNADGISDTRQRGSDSMLSEGKVNDVPSTTGDEKQAIEVSLLCPSIEGENKNDPSAVHAEKPPATMINSNCIERTDDDEMPSVSCKDCVPDNVDELKVGKADENVHRIDQNNNPLASESVETNVESKEVQEHHSGGAVPHKKSPAFPEQEEELHGRSRGSKLTGTEADEMEECACTTAAASFSAVKFDLNESFIADDGKYGELINLTAPGYPSALHLMNSIPSSVSSVSSSLPASITVAAAAKGPFVPPEDLLKGKGELGWKGSAATSAFRPAEPRKVLEMPLGTANSPVPDATTSKHGRIVLDIDLNVPDEEVLEDMASRETAAETVSTSDPINDHASAQKELVGSAPLRSSGGLDLDLNRVDEANDMGQFLTSSSGRQKAPLLPVKSPSSSGLPNGEGRRDFDLNNGPGFDDSNGETLSFNRHARVSMQSQPPIAILRMNNPEVRNISSWFPHGNTYSAVTIPSILPDRGELPFPIIAPGASQRMLGPASGSPFTPDIYRGSVLSSSPAVPFPSTPLQYPPVFPFGTSFPLPSATFSGGSTAYMDSLSGGRLCFPAVNTHLLGPASAISSNFQRPYMVSLSDGSNNGTVENNRTWNRQRLDLNAGPGGMKIEGRDETFPLASRQFSLASSQAQVEEQARMYQVAGCVLKRKDPEGS